MVFNISGLGYFDMQLIRRQAVFSDQFKEMGGEILIIADIVAGYVYGN